MRQEMKQEKKSIDEKTDQINAKKKESQTQNEIEQTLNESNFTFISFSRATNEAKIAIKKPVRISFAKI